MDGGAADLRRRYCAICGRRLKTARSVCSGVGPKCMKKTQCGKSRQTLLFEEEKQ
jgi:hypothetical protein